MIVGIDHLVLVCPGIESGVAAYAALLGRPPDWQSVESAGAASALFQLAHVALELLAPQGEGPTAERLNALLQERGPGLQSLVFATDDIEHEHRALRRRGLEPGPIEVGRSTDLRTGRERAWQRLRLGDAQVRGVRTFVLQRSAVDPLRQASAPGGALQDLDHLVITTTDPGRALGHYGARLGLELALDSTAPDGQSGLLVFRAGTSGIEVARRKVEPGTVAEDRLWGITWRTHDIDAANARLREHGHSVSEVRVGRRRGTRVFTVRDRTLGVPTLVVAVDAGTHADG